jgi:hypothetical protein
MELSHGGQESRGAPAGAGPQEGLNHPGSVADGADRKRLRGIHLRARRLSQKSLRNGAEPQSRQGARVARAVHPAGRCRRSDRMTVVSRSNAGPHGVGDHAAMTSASRSPYKLRPARGLLHCGPGLPPQGSYLPPAHAGSLFLQVSVACNKATRNPDVYSQMTCSTAPNRQEDPTPASLPRHVAETDSVAGHIGFEL